MVIGHGFSDPIWAAKQIIKNSHPTLLKQSVIDVIEHLESVGATGTSPFEIIDRLIQVASEGRYTPPPPVEEEVMRKVIHLEDGKLTPEAEKEIQDFIDILDRIPSVEDKGDEDDESYEDFLKRLGIPNEDDFREEDEEDDEE